MGNVIDLNAYRLFKAVQKILLCDGIKCKFSYDNQYFLDLSRRLISKDIVFPEFYNSVAAYAMSLNAVPALIPPVKPTDS